MDKNDSFADCGDPSLKLVKEFCKTFIDMEFSLKTNTSLEGIIKALDGDFLPKMKISSLYKGIFEALSRGSSLFGAGDHIKSCMEFEVVTQTRCINCEDTSFGERKFYHSFNLSVDGTEKATAVHIFEDLLKPLFPKDYVEDECMKCYDGVLEMSAILENVPPVLTLNLP